MIQVHINGLRCVPGIDYNATAQSISFKQAPAVGDDILVTSAIPGNSGGVHMQKIKGNGNTFLYNIDRTFDERVQLQRTLDDAWKYQGVPAVADVLARLQVVLELVKQDDTLYQR